MLEQNFSDIIKRQFPYYYLIDKPIKGLNNQYWIVFKHKESENFVQNILTLLSFKEKRASYKILRIDKNEGNLFEYIPKKEGNIPSVALLRTRKASEIEQFLYCINSTKENSLIQDSFLEITNHKPRRFNLPNDLDKYKNFLAEYLNYTKIYRRSTAYFNSGVLKFYQEPLANIIQNQGQIRLLMDWQGFTSQKDLETLKQLNEDNFKQTIKEFIQGLENGVLESTTILAELIRLNILQIKLVKTQGPKAIYHKKTGILTDRQGNSIYHDGSNNFTHNAHSNNIESVTFLYWNDDLAGDEINNAITEFDAQWTDLTQTFDISQDFLDAIINEHQKRIENNQPRIDSFTPEQIPAGQDVIVTITGNNLQDIETIETNELISSQIQIKSKEKLTAQFNIDPEHPAQRITTLTVSTPKGQYQVNPAKSFQVIQSLVVPKFEEIIGFKEAVEKILAGQHGNPDDFLYFLANQRPYLWNVKKSEILDDFLDEGILFEHQKSGAQHCQRVMKSFGMVVCADAVGLGKTRLAAAVAKLFKEEKQDSKIAIIAAKKLHDNWKREMAQLGFHSADYELYNKNLMGRKSNFLDDFNRYGGPDLIVIDEAHEGIRNYNNRIHKACLEIKHKDLESSRQRYYLLLSATPWNNRRADIYNILYPFISKPEAFREYGLNPKLVDWFKNREIGLEAFTDNHEIFRKTYKELFLQRTRKMLQQASPDLNFYAKRLAQWLPISFEVETEKALDMIFGEFENSLYIPSADPLRYLSETVEQRSLLENQRRIFLQRAESSMYSLRLTILNFSQKIKQIQERLKSLTPDAEGLKQLLLEHYQFESQNTNKLNLSKFSNYEEEEEDDDDEAEPVQEKRQQLKTKIEKNIANLQDKPEETNRIYNLLLEHCQSDLTLLTRIEKLLQNEFVKDHKRQQVSEKVAELVSQGHKVLLISVFSDTVIDYYRYMQNNKVIAQAGIGMAIGGTKQYLFEDNKVISISPYNFYKQGRKETSLTREELFKYFAPEASCRNPSDYPKDQIGVLIGSETLSVGQNLQDANHLICIDLPWNPMVLEQRIGRIDRPKKQKVDYIYIYYANSESQLLRQANRLDNLHKKLVGDTVKDGSQELGASIYGDTLFDDQVLPGYVEFLQNLLKNRQSEQENIYHNQENKDIYTENEILYSEELTKLRQRLGSDYQANPIALGGGDKSDPQQIAVLTLNYFGPNGEPIPEATETIYWNNLTAQQDGYGMAIATGFKTPYFNSIISANSLLKQVELLYHQLSQLKLEKQSQLKQNESIEDVKTTSARLNQIQKRLTKSDIVLPPGITPTTVRATLKTLNNNIQLKGVVRLLKNFTDGEKGKLTDTQFIAELVEDTNSQSLVDFNPTEPRSLTLKLDAVFLKV